MIGDRRIDDRRLAVVRLAFLGGHRRPNSEGVEIEHDDLVTGCQ
jgi:hypothetical protein